MKNSTLLVITITSLFFSSCSKSQDFKSISAPEFATTLNKETNEQLIDVRTPEEFNAGHIDQAKNINWNGSDFESEVSKLDKSKPVCVYCMSGGRSKRAASRLKELGFTTIIELDGGYLSWQKENTNSNSAWTGMTKEAYNKLLQSEKTVVIDFYAKWCEPCKQMAPYLEKISTELADKVIIHRIDADANQSLFNSLGYKGLPVIIVIKNGKQTFFKNEYVSETDLRKAL